MRESAEGYCDQQNREHGDWPALPTLLPFPCDKRKRQENNNAHGGTYQQNRCLGRWRKEREESIQPQKEEVRSRRRLNDSGIRLAARTEGTEISCARGDRKQDETREQDVLPNCIGHERHTLFVREVVILLQIGGSTNDASRHGPLVNS